METTFDPIVQDLESVLARLGELKDAEKLKSVLKNLLPKLLRNFDDELNAEQSVHKRVETYINVFSHIQRWTKSTCALPGQELCEWLIQHSKENQSARIGLMFVESTFDMLEIDEQMNCAESLLEWVATTQTPQRSPESQAKIVGLILPLVQNLPTTWFTGMKLEWMLQVCLDCCFPSGTFHPTTTKRGIRIGKPIKDKTVRTVEDDEARALHVARFVRSLGRSTQRRTTLCDAERDLLLSTSLRISLLCSTCHSRTDLREYGEEGIKEDAPDVTPALITALFVFVMGEPNATPLDAAPVAPTPTAPTRARVATVELLTKFPANCVVPESRFVKFCVLCLFGQGKTSKLVTVTLKLITKAAEHFGKIAAWEMLMHNSLKQIVASWDQISIEERAAGFEAFGIWISHHPPPAGIDARLTFQVALALQSASPGSTRVLLGRQEDELVASTAYGCLSKMCAQIKLLNDYSSLLNFCSGVAEDDSAGERLKLFVLDVAIRASSFICESGLQDDTTQRAMLISQWILLLATRKKSQRSIHEAAFRTLRDFHTNTTSFASFYEFLEIREGVWAANTETLPAAPHNYWVPCLNFMCKSITTSSWIFLSTLPPESFVQRLSFSVDITKCFDAGEIVAGINCLDAMLTRVEDVLIEQTLLERVLCPQTPDVSIVERFGALLSFRVDAVRIAASRLAIYLYKFWPEETDALVRSRLETNTSSLQQRAGIHGGLSVLEHASTPATIKLCAKFALEAGDREIQKLALIALTCVLERGEPIDETDRIVESCSVILKEKRRDESDECVKAAIGFMGSAASISTFVTLPQLLNVASDGRFGVGCQESLGRALKTYAVRKNALQETLNAVLDLFYFEDAAEQNSSAKTRASAAIVLEQLVGIEKQAWSSIDDAVVLDRTASGLCDLLGEPDEETRLSACRGLSTIYMALERQHVAERFTSAVVRAMTIQAAAAVAPPAQPQASSRGAEPASTAAAAAMPAFNAAGGAPRIRRGNLDRVWPFRDLCVASQQCGKASILFTLLRIAGSRTQHVPDEDVANAVLGIPITRLATQFLRRRHFASTDIGLTVANKIWSVKLVHENVFADLQLTQAVSQECARLIKESHLAKERSSALLSLSELCEKCDDPSKRVLPLHELWHLTFRGLDDIDPTVASNAAAALGRSTKRATLRAFAGESSTAAAGDRDDESLFNYLLNMGLNHTVKPARDLTRSFLVDAIAGKKPLPEKFAVRVVESLLKTVGESESMLLQYAQFHARGNGGTGELAVQASDLEAIRARLALDSPEYAAARKCALGLCAGGMTSSAVRACSDLVVSLARLVRTGVGLATLVCCSAMASFLASEEWPGRLVLDQDAELLKAVTLKFSNDPSFELKKRMSSAAAALGRARAASSAVIEYCETISRFYDQDPDAQIPVRLLAAGAVSEFVQKCSNGTTPHVVMEILARPAFLGRFDEDKSVAAMWRSIWEQNLSTVLTPEQVIALAEQAVQQPSYRTRKRGAEALIGLSASVLRRAADESEIAPIMLRLALSGGPVWEGKPTFVKACGTLFTHCTNLERVRHALVETTRVACALGTARDTSDEKWLHQALFEMVQKIMSAHVRVLDLAVRESCMLNVCEFIQTERNKEPVVWTSALNVVGSGIDSGLSNGVVEMCGQVFVRALMELDIAWNVKVAALQGLSKLFGQARMEEKKPWTFDVITILTRLLGEEKKPAVLLATVNAALSASSCLHLYNLGDLQINWSASATRLSKHADATIGKAANDLSVKLGVVVKTSSWAGDM